MQKRLTVKELKAALVDVPDELEVRFGSDTEEAYEITNEDDFNMLDESIRGAIPEETGLFKQITLTFNPWNEKHWIRKRFFGEIIGKDAQGNPTYRFHDSWTSPDGQIYATTTNYLCNEWLDEADLKVFQTMKDLVSEQFGMELDEVTLETSFEDDLGADSVDLVELVMAMEEEFELGQTAEDEVKAIKTVGDAVNYVAGKLNG